MSKQIGRAARKKGNAATVVIIVFLSIVAAMQIFPFYLQIVTSLQPMDMVPEVGKSYLWADGFHIENYIEAIERVGLLQGLLNSVIVAGGFTLLSAVVILLVGYVLGKKKLVSDLGWTNTFAGLILPGIVNITGIFLVMSFMNTIPNAVLESADIDGANELQKLFKIVLPMTLPILATYFILTFVGQWNDYLWPMVVTSDSDLFTIQLKLKEFNPYYGGFADEVLKNAASIFTLVPVIAVYLTCQKQFVSGLSISGMK